MKLHPRVTQTAVELAKRFEGFRPRAGKTPDGRFTIGYGHILGARDNPDQVEISEAEAEFLLKLDLSRVADEIEPALLAPVNDNQFAALLSFAFNIGIDNFKGSSALRRLNEGAYLQAAAAIELWRRADFGGEALVVDQLVRRRAVEKALFLAPPEGFTPVPSAVLRPAFDHSVVGAAVAWAAARERTAVSRLALEGPEVSAGLAIPPGREGEPAPSAAIAAADALAVRLSRILPEDVSEESAPAPGETPLLTLEAQDAAPAVEAPSFRSPANDATLEMPAFTAPNTSPAHLTDGAAAEPDAPVAADGELEGSKTRADAPAADRASALAATQSFLTDAPTLSSLAWSPPQQVQDQEPALPLSFDEPVAPLPFGQPQAAPATAEPPPFVDPVDLALSSEADFAATGFGEPHRPIGSRFARAFRAAAPEEQTPSLFDPVPPQSFAPSSPASAAPSALISSAPDAEVTPLFERPIFFVGLGLLGVALFVGSIFCMLHKASFGCLLIGVVGVLALAPSAAFFLFRFLGAPVDPTHSDHAAVLGGTHDGETATAVEAPAPSEFDRFPAD